MEAVESLIAHHRSPGHVPLVGIAGAQGSGKTTLARAAAERFGGVQMSLDDVYFGKAERQALARDLHPLFATRGTPLTHDLDLLTGTIAALRAAGPDTVTTLPAFDKVADDRVAPAERPNFTGCPGVIFLDGWCLGARAQAPDALILPINILEAEQDPDGRWRSAVNDALAGPYAQVFTGFDAILFLAAPSYDVVLDWRCEQEAGLIGVPILPTADRARIAGFVQYFERITRSMLAGGIEADTIVRLDENRSVTGVEAG